MHRAQASPRESLGAQGSMQGPCGVSPQLSGPAGALVQALQFSSVGHFGQVACICWAISIPDQVAAVEAGPPSSTAATLQ